MTKLLILIAVIGLVTLGSVVAVVSPREKTSLNIEVVQGKILSQTSDTLVLLAPAKYKIIRAAYGDDCFYSLTRGSIYGTGEDITPVIESVREDNYRITCQPLIGKGAVSKVMKTVVVLDTRQELRSSR